MRESDGVAMSVFSASMNHRSFWWQISAVCFVLGLILATAVHTAAQIGRAGVAPNRAGFFYGGDAQVAQVKSAQYEGEIKRLREQKTQLEKVVAKGTDASDTLNKELQDTKFLAGLTEAVGPGVQVTLVDSQKRSLLPSDQLKLSSLIHDSDIANVVNELKAAGAEAIAVNGQRVVSTTAVRCVGPVVHVNGVPAAPPYVIQAIGDADALYGGLNLPNGVLDDLRRFDPGMARVEKKPKLRVSAFAGSTQMRFARLPKSSGSGKESHDSSEKESHDSSKDSK